MSTFLQLCQSVRQECGLAGDGPTSVASQTGVLKKVVDRTSRAWVDIQASKPNWFFLRRRSTSYTVIGVRGYNILTDLLITDFGGIIDTADVHLFDGVIGLSDETPLQWESYTANRMRQRPYNTAKPTRIAYGLSDSGSPAILFDSFCDKVYTFPLEYWAAPEVLVDNNDTPNIPSQFHDLIVWKSVMMFAGSEGAPELFSYAKSMYQPLYMQLAISQGELPGKNADFPLSIGPTSNKPIRSF